MQIADYALIGDCCTSALLSREGSIDWLCWPRFDSAACFAALLGTRENGHWLIAPTHSRRIERRYCPGTLVVETEFATDEGSVKLIDFMPIGQATTQIVRIVAGQSGRVAMKMEFVVRFDYGKTVPWIRRLEDNTGVCAIAGPHMVVLRSPVPLEGKNLTTVSQFVVNEGERFAFVLAHGPSHLSVPEAVDAESALNSTTAYWRKWSNILDDNIRWHDAIERSLLTLKALTYAPTGSIVAAPTTSLPEHVGGIRNWDYRYCWIRDATLTLLILMEAGHYEEADAWRRWLSRAVAGSPEQLQIMYGIGGERMLEEWEISWLRGFKNSVPVRIGNAASHQLQIDVYGELMDALYQARKGGLPNDEAAWAIQVSLLKHLETLWRQPDEGIWEIRGKRQHFTHSKVMAWVAFDRAIKSIDQFNLKGPRDRWIRIRGEIHADVCERGFDAKRNTFVQSYGTPFLDASLLQIPLIGFLPHDDPRVKGTIAAVEKELMVDGLVRRYLTHEVEDGLPAGEGVFLPCSFWLVDNYILQGRHDEACALFERLLSLCNDVGLLSEEYDPQARELRGNFPQAFSHTALIHTALNLSTQGGFARKRRQ
ncbi:MAG TPA: glycoside hydrolase family 15 protein [Rhodocyclaceae bacterium]|nr:glycoside hydrolase family 15 protein [Rhodocyclaceae bacterium]